MNMSNSDSYDNSKLVLAKWTDMFFAWIVDFMIILIVLIMINILVIEVIFGGSISEESQWVENVSSVTYVITFFSYWTVLEFIKGQSIGKKALNLMVIDINGGRPTLKGVVLSSFGKTILLPVDFILGLIITNEKRQRIFNKLGDTIVVKVKGVEDDASYDRYVKD